MLEFRKLKIKTKLALVVLLTCTTGLVLASVGVLTFDRFAQKNILAEEMTILAKVVASRSAAALSFEDPVRARDNLSALLVRDSIEFSCIFDSAGNVFAEVARTPDETARCPSSSNTIGQYFGAGFLQVFQPIELNGTLIGKVLVYTNLKDLNGRLQNQIIASVLILVISLAAAFLVTRRLQRAIYQPIVDLGEVAMKITEHNNFSIRAKADSEDEIGDAIFAFNSMLNKIEADTEELTRLAYYDPLTKLANRRMFSERLVFALENSRRSNESMGLIFIDLDKFKEINDALGHDIGDLLLNATAKRLESAIPGTASAFRLGGDEFTVLQVGVGVSDLEQTAESILKEFREPLIIAGRQLVISASIGVAISDGNDSVASLMKNADRALYQAKGKGRSGYQLYNGGTGT